MTDKNKTAIKKMIATCLAVALFFGGIWAIIYDYGETKSVFVPYYKKPKIILDAGHGGFDGGAVGLHNVVEKDINLLICQKLQEILTLNGFEVIMTRESDEAIGDPSLNTLGEKKRSDMYRRREIMEENPDGLFLSIHQNKFEEASSKGSQIFYSVNNPDSKRLAELLQTGFRENLQPKNQRQIKEAGKELFLLYHAQIPSVLVECGFLSNEEDCANLMDEEYQNKVAFCIYLSLMNYFNS